MNIKAVLFDLDGTLLPMEMDSFVKAYFGLLAEKLAPYGYEKEKLISAIWAGTKAMVMNNGNQTNETAFWNKFCEIFGKDAIKDEPIFAEFYEKEFSKVQAVCGYTENASKAVAKVKEKGLRVALATNPIFPAIATQNRIKWAGLTPTDFEFYTTYENSSYCKPNPKYYEFVLNKLGLKPQECLMVGNDVGEDMIANTLGMNVFLLTDCIINKANEDISRYPHGDFNALFDFLDNL